jgi:hypothetical protein
MAQYRFLQDCYVGTAYVNAGDVASTADVGGALPANFIPPAAVDPLDTPAVNAFYAQGPQTMPLLVRQQWSTIPVNVPVTYWKQIPGGKLWQLTGLGAGLPPIGM